MSIESMTKQSQALRESPGQFVTKRTELCSKP